MDQHIIQIWMYFSDWSHILHEIHRWFTKSWQIDLPSPLHNTISIDGLGSHAILKLWDIRQTKIVTFSPYSNKGIKSIITSVFVMIERYCLRILSACTSFWFCCVFCFVLLFFVVFVFVFWFLLLFFLKYYRVYYYHLTGYVGIVCLIEFQ